MSRRVSGSKSVRLKSQIILAMGSVLFLFALVTGVYFSIVIFMSGQGPSESQPGVQFVRLADQAKASLLSAQNSAHMYILHQDNALKERHQAHLNELLDQAKQLQAGAANIDNTEAAAAADKINAQIPAYSKAFQELTKALEERGGDNSSGLREELVSAGQKVMDIVERNKAGNLALALLEVQHAQNEYFRTNKADARQNLVAAVKDLARVARDSRIDPLDAQMLRKNIEMYTAAMDRYLAVSLASNDPTLSSTLGKEQQRQADAMRSAAGEIETIISRVNVPDAMDLLLKVRQHETAYLLFGTPASVNQFDKYLDDLISAFNKSSILQAHKKELVATSRQYRDSFKSLAESNKTINDLASRLDDSASTLLASINKASQIKTQTQSIDSQLPFSLGMNQLALLAALGCLIVILIGLIVAILLGRAISYPIVSMTQILRRVVKDEDFSVEIPVTSKNEIGSLAVELNKLLQLQRSVSDQSPDTSNFSSEDSGVIDTSNSLFENNINKMTNVSDSLQVSLQGLSGLNVRVTDTISNQSALEEQAQDVIQKISQTAGQLQQIFDTAAQGRQDISDPAEQATSSGEATIASISTITQLFGQISDLINLSVDTAEQTNLLALNATVKAARAGSHGKEFSLVADEIAKLTNRSEDIAREASQLAKDLTQQIEKTIPAADEVRPEPERTESADMPDSIPPEDFSVQAAALSSYIDELNHILEQFISITREIQSIAQEQEVETITAQEAVAKLFDTTGPMDQSPVDSSSDAVESDDEFINNISARLEADEDFENDSDEDGRRETDEDFSLEPSEDVQKTDSEKNIDPDIPGDADTKAKQ